MSSYPVPSRAVPVSAGMIIAVPLELVASPLKSGRNLGDANRSALVIGGTGKVRTGGTVVFCKVVAVAGAQVKRDGQVRAKGSPVHHATLGPLEGKTGPGVIGQVAERAPLAGRFVKGQRERLLARAFMIRVIVAMTLMPQARIGDVIAALAGGLALVAGARPWRPADRRPGCRRPPLPRQPRPPASPRRAPRNRRLRRSAPARHGCEGRRRAWPGRRAAARRPRRAARNWPG